MKNLSLFLTILMLPFILFGITYLGMRLYFSQQPIVKDATAVLEPAVTTSEPEQENSLCGNGICSREERLNSSCSEDC
ncbi:MAG: hypothetical protein WCT28_04365 [Patescibacteria group bacterium]|jgi:hypothetical protein